MPRLIAHPFCLLVLLFGPLLAGCSHLVKISYSPGAVIHPTFDQPTTNWEGERVQIVLTPSLRGEPLEYLAKNEKVFLASSLRQHGLHHIYKITGQGTPLVYSSNPGVTPKEKHYPHSGIVLGIVGSVGNRLKRHSKTVAQALKEIAADNPRVLNRYFARVSTRGGPTGLFSLAPNPCWIVWLPCLFWSLFTVSSETAD
jgi:hypothetical protein